MNTFVTHYDYQSGVPLNQIESSCANSSLSYVIAITFMAIILTMRNKNELHADTTATGGQLTRDTTTMLKGAAVILVVLGHLNTEVIAGIIPIEYMGAWGVTKFLFVSGAGLAESYGVTN